MGTLVPHTPQHRQVMGAGVTRAVSVRANPEKCMRVLSVQAVLRPGALRQVQPLCLLLPGSQDLLLFINSPSCDVLCPGSKKKDQHLGHPRRAGSESHRLGCNDQSREKEKHAQ